MAENDHSTAGTLVAYEASRIRIVMRSASAIMGRLDTLRDLLGGLEPKIKSLSVDVCEELGGLKSKVKSNPTMCAEML